MAVAPAAWEERPESDPVVKAVRATAGLRQRLRRERAKRRNDIADEPWPTLLRRHLYRLTPPKLGKFLVRRRVRRLGRRRRLFVILKNTSNFAEKALFLLLRPLLLRALGRLRLLIP